MREILFRGKSKKTGELVHGLITGHKPGESMSFISNADYPWEISVIPETVGQWTGLNDIEGTKIFEGDILEFEYERKRYRRAVGWFGDSGYPAFDFDGANDFSEYNGLVWLTREGDVNCTVVGNIYDNLKGANNAQLV